MLIESMRNKPVSPKLFGDVYHFKKNDVGDYVCDVDHQEAIDRFLSIKTFRPYGDVARREYELQKQEDEAQKYEDMAQELRDEADRKKREAEGKKSEIKKEREEREKNKSEAVLKAELEQNAEAQAKAEKDAAKKKLRDEASKTKGKPVGKTKVNKPEANEGADEAPAAPIGNKANGK